MNDITKLPKWARQRIEQLENSVQYYKDQAKTVNEGSSRVTWGMHEVGGHVVGIPEGERVRIDLGNGDAIKFSLDDKNPRTGPRVYVSLETRSGRGIAFHPGASNAGHLGVTPT